MFSKDKNKEIKNFCPLIKNECLKDKCKFWKGLWNSGMQKMDYDCVSNWDTELKIEILGLLSKQKGE